MIPKLSKDCTRCHKYVAGRFVGYDFCSDHPDGQDYNGPAQYTPTEWVNHVVGQAYSCNNEKFECTGYDPRCGFWMKNLDPEKPMDVRNLSERAINRTYHRVKTPGR